MVSVTFLKCSRCSHTNVNNVVGHTLFSSGSGQVFLLSQLQLSVSVFCDWLFLIICALCLVIIDLTLCMQLYSLLLKCFC